MTKISVVINTLNEEKNLPRAIASIKNFADEIVVVDMHSDDKTVEIAKKLGAKVYLHERTSYVEPARNFAISKVMNQSDSQESQWVLILDADEEIPDTLSKKLKELVEKNTGDYFRIPRKNIIFGKWMQHSRWWPDYNIRFFKKGFVSWSEEIHSIPITKGKGADLEAKEELAIIHHNYESIEQYLERLNRYTSIQSDKLKEQRYKFDWKDLIKKPTGEFLSRFFAAGGYKDGIHGLALSSLQAFSEFVLYLKLWQKDKFKEEKLDIKEFVSVTKEIKKEINYWESDALVKEQGSILHRIKRKLRI